MKYLALLILLGTGVARGQMGQIPKHCSMPVNPGVCEGILPAACDELWKKYWIDVTCVIWGSHLVPDDAPNPEPMDVPAIFGPDKEYRDFPDGQIICGLAETLELGGLIDHCRQKFPTRTCADKSRILLTDESGGKHCIKFPKEEIK